MKIALAILSASVATVAAWEQAAQGQPAAAASERVAVVEGFDVPESARYDSERDVYYVSNVTGRPTVDDNTGFISRMGPNGEILDRKWIAGGVNGVTLNGPKGMVLAGNDLWVTDISVVRRFDRRTGVQAGLVDFAPLGAGFLNDVAIGPDGSLFVSDTGLVFDANGGAALTGPQRIYQVSRSGAISILTDGPALRAPNGLLYDARTPRLLVAPLGGRDVFEWSAAQGLRVLATGPGGYDGIDFLADGRVVVSSQAGTGVFVLGGAGMTQIVAGVGQTGDLGVDTRRNQVAVPRLDNNTVEIWRLKPS
jgi:sugar lactone lactonase YvrE